MVFPSVTRVCLILFKLSFSACKLWVMLGPVSPVAATIYTGHCKPRHDCLSP